MSYQLWKSANEGRSIDTDLNAYLSRTQTDKCFTASHEENPAAWLQSLTSRTVLTELPPVSAAVTVTKYFPFRSISSAVAVLWKGEKYPHCSQIEEIGPWAQACISRLHPLPFIHRRLRCPDWDTTRSFNVSFGKVMQVGRFVGL